MIEAILSSTLDKTIIEVTWLNTETQFNHRMPKYLKKIGMLAGDHQGSAADLLTPVDKDTRAKEFSDARATFAAAKLAYSTSHLPEAVRLKEFTAAQVAFKERMTQLDAKYAGQ
jgi:hypothetical protein